MRKPLIALTVLSLATIVGTGVAKLVDTPLPLGTLGELPQLHERPESVPAGAKVPGIFPAAQPEEQLPDAARDDGSRWVTIFTNAQDASDHSSGTFNGMDAGDEVPTHSACMTTVNEWMLREAKEWPIYASEQETVWGAKPGSAAAERNDAINVTALHVEHIEPADGDKAYLVSTNVWVDAITAGAQLINESRFELVEVSKIRTAHNGTIRVFAGHEKSTQTVHFVVQGPAMGRDARSFMFRGTELQRGTESSSSSCGHARVPLRYASGAGEAGWVELDVITEVEDLPAEGGMMPSREITTRRLRINLGARRDFGEEAPKLNVSYGWRGTEQRNQIPVSISLPRALAEQASMPE